LDHLKPSCGSKTTNQNLSGMTNFYPAEFRQTKTPDGTKLKQN